MTRFLLLCGTAWVAAFSNGCSDPPTDTSPALGDVSIVTDKAEYSLATDSLAVVTFINRTNRAFHFPMGEYLAYERLVDGKWVDGYAWFTVDGIGRSWPIEPMASRHDELQLWFYLAGQPGTYRFQYFVYTTPRLSLPLPLAQRVSAPFVVTP